MGEAGTAVEDGNEDGDEDGDEKEAGTEGLSSTGVARRLSSCKAGSGFVITAPSASVWSSNLTRLSRPPPLAYERAISLVAAPSWLR